MRITEQMIVTRAEMLVRDAGSVSAAAKSIGADYVTFRKIFRGETANVRLSMLDRMGLKYHHPLIHLTAEELAIEIKMIYGSYSNASEKIDVSDRTLQKLAHGRRVSVYFTLFKILDGIDDTESKEPECKCVKQFGLNPALTMKLV